MVQKRSQYIRLLSPAMLPKKFYWIGAPKPKARSKFDIAYWYSYVWYYVFSMYSCTWCVWGDKVFFTLAVLSSAPAVPQSCRLLLCRKIPGCGREASARYGCGGRRKLHSALQHAGGSGGAAGVVLQRQSHKHRLALPGAATEPGYPQTAPKRHGAVHPRPVQPLQRGHRQHDRHRAV